jgi:WD40 repeat protein
MFSVLALNHVQFPTRSPRDLLLSGSRDRSAKLFNLQGLEGEGDPACEEKIGHARHILGSAASKELILTSSSDGSVKVPLNAPLKDVALLQA